MNFAFLIHSRDYTDVQRKFKIAKYLPRSWVEWWCLHWPPVIVSKITSLKDKDGQECKGWLIGVPLTAKQMMENRQLAKKRIIQAIKKAEELGAKIVGLGALTSSVTNGGLEISDKVNIKVTTGNALTSGVAFNHIKEIVEQNDKIQKIGIVGATGSIGQALSKILIKNYPEKEFLLCTRTKEKLDNLINELKEISPQAKTKGVLGNLNDLKEANLVVVATSSPGAFIKSEQLKFGAIIYDITQPQNISIDEIKNRPDLKIYDGGLIFVPQLKEKLPLGLPENTVFACLGETILLALENNESNCSLGKVEIKTIKEIIKLAGKYNFKPYSGE